MQLAILHPARRPGAWGLAAISPVNLLADGTVRCPGRPGPSRRIVPQKEGEKRTVWSQKSNDGTAAAIPSSELKTGSRNPYRQRNEQAVPVDLRTNP